MAEQSRTLGELARLVGGELAGDPAIPIRGVAGLDRAQPEELSFVASSRYRQAAEESRAAAFLVPSGLELPGRAVIRVPQPYLALGWACSRRATG